ncbi:MAG: hypothetical protein M1833_004529 [Piccolia ochrophora]|nr:MAG: hypothetical protein M1833_004529 [Piccolia ochrophora]
MRRRYSPLPSTAVLGAIACTLIWFASAELDPTSSSPLGVYWALAPAPEDGPPLSATASRDKALLPAQIGAIVGAYLLVVVVFGLLWLFVGRRLRSKIETSRRTLDVEMVKPTLAKLEASPASPVSKRSWPSPTSAWTKWATPKSQRSPITPKSPQNFSWPSPTKSDFSGFDQRVLDDDKARGERDMERLYAAVMEQDAKNEAKVLYEAKRSPSQVSAQGPPRYSQQQMQPRSAPFRRKTPPPPLSSPVPGLNAMRPTPTPGSPSYPYTDSPTKHAPPDAKASRTHSRTPSLTSTHSKRKSGRHSKPRVRGLPISSPIPTPTYSVHSRAASDEEPLSPRFPPPTPPAVQRISPTSPTATIDGELRAYDARTQSAQPSSYTRQQPQRLDIQTQPRHHQHVKPLPLRNLITSGGRGSASDVGPSSPNSQTTTVTVLERPAAGQGPNSPLRTGAQVPYSPYMPFTPMTPITPRLVTRQERKAREKAEGKEVVREMAKSEGELWDSAY